MSFCVSKFANTRQFRCFNEKNSRWYLFDNKEKTWNSVTVSRIIKDFIDYCEEENIIIPEKLSSKEILHTLYCVTMITNKKE